MFIYINIYLFIEYKIRDMSFYSLAARTLFCQLLKIHRMLRISMLSGILIIRLASDNIKVAERHTHAYREGLDDEKPM